jgi:hypothetical protein
MDASNEQIGAKRAAIRKVCFIEVQKMTSFFTHTPLRGLQLDHELGIPIGSVGLEDFQLITRIHYIAGALLTPHICT